MAEIVGSGSRLSTGPSARLADTAFSFELEAREVLFDAMNLADLAHAFELRRAELIDDEVLTDLLSALVELDETGAGAVTWDPLRGDIYNNRTAWVQDRIGSSTDYLHAGRARREVTTLAWQLACRVGVLEVARGLVNLLEALKAVAVDHAQTAMADLTYLQHAQPTTLAHYVLSFAAPLCRDLDRLRELFGRLNCSPAGSGSVNGTVLPIVREHLAEDLGFESLVANTRDAMWMSDVAIEIGTTTVSPLVTCGRLADELIIWSTMEFGFFESDDSHSRNSVIMPQKKNPYALAHVRGAPRVALGALTSICASQMTPSGQPDNRIYSYLAGPTGLLDAAGSAELLAEVLERGTFDREALSRQALAGHTYATDLCDLLTLEAGLSNRVAHQIVGSAVRRCIERGSTVASLGDLEASASDLGVELPQIEFADRVDDPLAMIELRATSGGASQASVQVLVDEVSSSVDAASQWMEAASASIRKGNELVARAKGMV